MLAKARILLTQNRVVDALLRVKAAADVDPGNVLVHFTLGTLYIQTNEPAEAIKSFREVLRLNPQAVEAHVQLARLYPTVGDFKSAISVADEALAIQPDNAELRLGLARNLLAAGNTTRAEAEGQTVAAQLPNLPTSISCWVRSISPERTPPRPRGPFNGHCSSSPTGSMRSPSSLR